MTQNITLEILEDNFEKLNQKLISTISLVMFPSIDRLPKRCLGSKGKRGTSFIRQDKDDVESGSTNERLHMGKDVLLDIQNWLML